MSAHPYTDWQAAARTLLAKEGATMGPLNKLLRGLGLDDKLPEIPKVKPIETAVDIFRKRPDVKVTRNVNYRTETWEAMDLSSFDYEPGSRWHIVGTGDTPNDAVKDLMEGLRDAQAAQDLEGLKAPIIVAETIFSSQFEPPETRVKREYRDEDYE
jgi:hypothetical protein